MRDSKIVKVDAPRHARHGGFCFVPANDGQPIPLLNLDPVDYPFGLRLREIAGDPGRCANGRPEHRSHNDLTIKEDGQELPQVVSGCCAHFRSPRCLEFDTDAIFRWAWARNDSSHCDIAIGNDYLVMKVNRSIRTYFGLTQARTRTVFGQPYFKANGCPLQVANEHRPHPWAKKRGGDHHQGNSSEESHPRPRSHPGGRLGYGSRRKNRLTAKIMLARRKVVRVEAGLRLARVL